MTTLILIVIGMIVLMLVGVPVAFAFGVGSFILLTLFGLDQPAAVSNAFQFLFKFPLLALPLFILLGALMNTGGLARRLIDFVDSVVGRVRGGLGVVLIVTNAIFGAMSGVATSALATIGTIMIPQMERLGYPRGYSTGFAVSSCVLVLLIPPSTSMIIFGIAGRISIPLLFAATLIPGVILTVILSIINMIMSRNIPTIQVRPKISSAQYSKNVFWAGKSSFFVLLLPLIILGGIYGGVFTPTEAAAVAVVYALIVGWFYHLLNVRTCRSALLEAGSITGCVVIILFFFFILSRILIVEQIPSLLLSLLLQISENKMILLLILNVMLIITGMFMDDASGLILSAIIYLPVAKAIGLNPLHFGAIVGVNLGMGLITPPVAPILYLGGIVGGNLPLSEYIKPAMYCIIFGYLPVLLLTTYIPELSLALPNLVLGLIR